MKPAKLIILSLLTMVILMQLSSVFGESEITVTLNGKQLEFETTPYIKDGRVLVPLRKIAEAMGATVLWDDQTKAIQVFNNDTSIFMKIGDKEAFLNYNQVQLDVPSEITNDRTFVPLRFIGESMKAEVKWNAQNRNISITYNDTVSQIGITSKFGDKEITIETAFLDKDRNVYIVEGTMDNGINSLSFDLFDSYGYSLPMNSPTIKQQGEKQFFYAERNCRVVMNSSENQSKSMRNLMIKRQLESAHTF